MTETSRTDTEAPQRPGHDRAPAGADPVLVTLPNGMACYTTPERFELFSEID